MTRGRRLEKASRKISGNGKRSSFPDPEAEGETLTFRYREIDPGSSVLTDDIAIITGMIYNTKHERANDTMVKAVRRRTARRILTGSKKQSGVAKQGYVAGFRDTD